MAKKGRFSQRVMVLVLALMLVSLLGVALPAAAQEPVTLTYGWWSNGPTSDAAHREWLDAFEAEHPNIKIESEILPWNAYWDKVRTTTAGGTSYDIIGLCSCFAGLYMDNGIFLDLTQFADFEEVAAAVDPNALSIFTWDEAQYVLPVGLAIRSLGYNKDLFDAAGVDYPDPTTPLTIDQLVELSKKLTIVDENGDVTQYTWNPTNAEFHYSLIDYRGGQVYDSWVKPTQVTINTPEGIAGLEDLKRLVDEKVIPPLAELTGNQWGDGGLSSLLTTKVAMADLGPWNFADIVKDELAIGNTVYPVLEDGQTPILHSGANGYGINTMTQHPEEAWEFLKWMSSKDAQLEYATWSDFPANTEAFQEVGETLEPAELMPALVAQMEGFRSSLVTVDPELGNAMFEVMRDMTEGRLTPEEAAAEMERRGNEILGYEG